MTHFFAGLDIALATSRRLTAELEAIAAGGRRSRNGPMFDQLGLATYIRARHARRDFFGDLFADPSWDILLGLALCQQIGQRVSISAACSWSDVAPTTGLRHVVALERAGMVFRVPDPQDNRRAWLELTDRARGAWEAWNGDFRRWQRA